MQQYEITIENGEYPLKYIAPTIADAFGCLMEARKRSDWVELDPEGLMETLVDMHAGDTVMAEGPGWRIGVTGRVWYGESG